MWICFIVSNNYTNSILYTSDKDESWGDCGNCSGTEGQQILPHFKVIHETQMYVRYLQST